jgi:hypothetical protein
MLARIGATGSITRLDTQSGVAFYKVANADGSECYAWGRAKGGGLSGGCLSRGLRQPILDFSVVEVDRSSGVMAYRNLQGVAADGVALVRLVAVNGESQSVRVSHNVYELPRVKLMPLKRFEALDRAGAVVYMKSLR